MNNEFVIQVGTVSLIIIGATLIIGIISIVVLIVKERLALKRDKWRREELVQILAHEKWFLSENAAWFMLVERLQSILEDSDTKSIDEFRDDLRKADNCNN